MSICIITPRMPPSMDGLADYCYQLYQHWPNGERPKTFLVLDSADESRKQCSQYTTTQFEPTENGLLSKLEQTEDNIVLLQYVGYGFDLNGCPMWLPAALKKWLGSDSNRRLAIMFHETWSSGMPWQKTFWFMGKQKQCVSELMLLASHMVTSCQVNRRSLQVLGIDKPIEIIPLGCSFTVNATETKNWQQLLIFGKEYARVRGVQTHVKLLKQLIKQGAIERVVLAGQCTGKDLAAEFIQDKLPSVNLVTAYNFDSSQVPLSVRESGLSLMHTQSTHLLKSTSFHLAAKLGQVSIAENSGPADAPFIADKHYLAYPVDKPDALIGSLKDQHLESISRDVSQLASTYLSWREIAQTWYQVFQSLA